MDGADRADDRTFRSNFTAEGAAKLRDKVKEKLKEFMGDYTDDTLVEYVIVLLKNGRRKEEARNELNVFLGDDSDSFISWLWDHLGSSLDLYVQPRESHPDEAARAKPTCLEQAERKDFDHIDSEAEGGKFKKLSKKWHNREWKGLERDAYEPPPLRSSITISDHIHIEEDTHTHRKGGQAKDSLSQQPTIHKKRSRPDERQQAKSEVSQATIGASRRLLQFAVCDAVGTPRPSNSSTEPSLKRLRSVVSTSTGDSSLEDRPRRIRSVLRAPKAMETAIKAVAEAAKDVVKVRSSGNVFDRLGRCADVSETTNPLSEFRETAVEDGGFSQIIREETHPTYFQRSDYSGQYVGNLNVMENDDVMASDSASDNERFDHLHAMGRSVMDVCQTGTSRSTGNESKDTLMVQSSVADNASESMREPWKDQDQPTAVANNTHKIVNISVNVNTWKPPHYQESREVSGMDSLKSVLENEAGTGKSVVQYMKGNSNPVTAGNGNMKPATEAQIYSQTTLPSAPVPYSMGRPTEDADSRTIFISNVHFAATKDSLSRHFNKFGKVLKVIMVTDAATGQPKGSAYVEFMRKEAAEHALSLDGTSFMSRILKVVPKGSANQEAAPVLTWPRIARGSPFASSRFPRTPFARGIPSVYKSRLPVKPGARSLQWKRDAQSSSTLLESSSAFASSNSIPSPIAAATRSLTYVRPELKTNGNSGAT